MANYFTMKIPIKKELQQIASYHLSDSEALKDYTKEPFSTLLNNATLPSGNSLRIRKNLLYDDCQWQNQNNR